MYLNHGKLLILPLYLNKKNLNIFSTQMTSDKLYLPQANLEGIKVVYYCII